MKFSQKFCQGGCRSVSILRNQSQQSILLLFILLSFHCCAWKFSATRPKNVIAQILLPLFLPYAPQSLHLLSPIPTLPAHASPEQSPQLQIDSPQASNAYESPTKPKLTARDLISNDVTPRTEALKNILFTMKLYTPIIASEPERYPEIIRTQLRSIPSNQLRNTCKALRKYLPSQSVINDFDQIYSKLIEAIGEVDVLCLKKMQGDGFPSDGEERVRRLLLEVYGGMDALISVAER